MVLDSSLSCRIQLGLQNRYMAWPDTTMQADDRPKTLSHHVSVDLCYSL